MSAGYVYLLESAKRKQSYAGCTTNIRRRIQEHNHGLSLYTKSRGPWKLIGYETFPNFRLAKEYERKLKCNSNMHFLFKKRAFATFVKESNNRLKTQELGMIPPPVFPPKAESAF